MQNPYKKINNNAFWRHGVTRANPFNMQGIYKKKWDIDPNWKVATAGSCFAQHISRYMRSSDFNFIDMELAPEGLPKNKHSMFGYSMYSARYGNIYTIRQLLQLAQEVEGTYTPSEITWEKKGKFYDALRPNIEPEGLNSSEEALIHREYHLSRVKAMFKEMDLFIFTLGLTEAWVSKVSGTVFPTAPGAIAGQFNSDVYEFKNFEFNEIMNDFSLFEKSINNIRGQNSPPHYLLTVSPVPLTATASGSHILQATTYSKSLLRAVAGQLTIDHSHIDYFPSYEIITNQAAHGAFYESDLQSIRADGVDSVMKVFLHEQNRRQSGYHCVNEPLSKSTSHESLDPVCEEQLLNLIKK